MIGLLALAYVLGAAKLSGAAKDHEPEHALPVTCCEGRALRQVVGVWQVGDLYPRPWFTRTLQPERN